LEIIMTRTIPSSFALCAMLAVCCAPKPVTRSDIQIRNAGLVTERYAQSRLSRWNVRASAAGSDCAVLFLETSVILEDAMVEAMHYGAGAYDVYDGGVQRFSREHAFRGVAYKDRSGRVWSYGAVTPAEAERLASCH
jgi:hypothetical protein